MSEIRWTTGKGLLNVNVPPTPLPPPTHPRNHARVCGPEDVSSPRPSRCSANVRSIMAVQAVHLWLRAETKPNERRTHITPERCKDLVQAGMCVIFIVHFLKRTIRRVKYTLLTSCALALQVHLWKDLDAISKNFTWFYPFKSINPWHIVKLLVVSFCLNTVRVTVTAV